MAHAHHVNDDRREPSTVGRDLGVALGANAVLLVAQVAGALAFGSLALLADSVHQASDVVSLVLALVVAQVVARPASRRYTFGFGRADALGGLAHAVLLLAASGWIVVEGVERLTGDHDVDGAGVIVLALAGLAVNGFSARWLHRGHGTSLNVRGAALHLAADAAGSLVVLVSAVVVVITGVDRVDVAGSFVVAALIVWSALTLGWASVRVLLDAVPPGVDLDELRSVILADPMVSDAHHLHVRALTGDSLSLTAHVRVDTDQLHDAQEVTRRLTATLEGHGIDHVTLQAECHPCEEPGC